MNTRANRALAVTFGLMVVGTTAAFAAGPLKGKTYEGSAPSAGIRTEHHRIVNLHAGGNIVLRVASNGKSVTVRFSSSSPVLYCNTTKKLQVQTTKSARISSSGSFTASIDERFASGPGPPAIVQVVSGRFSGGSVSGSIQTNAAECSGRASFSAKAR